MPPPGAPEFSAWFRRFQRSCFRLETLQHYGGSGEDDSIMAFLAGESPSPHPGKLEWMALVRAAVTAGRTMQRVHVVVEPLSEYMVFEVAWSYAYSVAAGEDVRIIVLPLDAQPWPRWDFWLFDDDELFSMDYGADGTWRGVEHIVAPGTVREAQGWRRTALRFARPWREYINARPDLARRVPDVQRPN